MGGGQKRTIICGCGKHIKGSIREATSRAKIHGKVCDQLDITNLDIPFEAGMNGMNGLRPTRHGRHGFVQQPMNGVVTVDGEEIFRDEVQDVIQVLQIAQLLQGRQ